MTRFTTIALTLCLGLNGWLVFETLSHPKNSEMSRPQTQRLPLELGKVTSKEQHPWEGALKFTAAQIAYEKAAAVLSGEDAVKAHVNALRMKAMYAVRPPTTLRNSSSTNTPVWTKRWTLLGHN